MKKKKIFNILSTLFISNANLNIICIKGKLLLNTPCVTPFVRTTFIVHNAHYETLYSKKDLTECIIQ